MIIVFGSITMDIFMSVPHLPRTGETVIAPAYEMSPGGKGANQALAARRAGAHVMMIGAVGKDPFAKIGTALMDDAGVDLSAMAHVDAPTGAAFITVDAKGENAITVASGANAFASAKSLAHVPLGPKGTLLMQREVPEAEQIEAARIARAKGARVLLNVAPEIFTPILISSFSNSATIATSKLWISSPMISPVTSSHSMIVCVRRSSSRAPSKRANCSK